jgi:hypothetical protein
MLSLTIFAAAVPAATRQAPVTDAAPKAPPFARRPDNVTMPERPEYRRVISRQLPKN